MNKISVIIVTYNSEKTIASCIKSLKNIKGVETEIVVVDNNSQDQTIEELRTLDLKSLKIIKKEKNLGFSKANNLGFRESSGDIIFFLNPDTKILTGDFKEFFEYIAENEMVGLAGIKLVDEKGDPQKSLRNLPTVWRAINEYVFGSGGFEFYSIREDKITEVESVVGAAMILRRKVYEQFAFDEKYFLYFEDLDLCRKIRNKGGLKVIYYPFVSAMHTIGHSASTNPKVRSYIANSSKKYHGAVYHYILELIFQYARVKRFIRVSLGL